jgi:type IV secretion system protein TrbI
MLDSPSATALPSSPNSLELRGAPRASARLSKKAAFIVITALALILCVIMLNVSKDPHRQSSSTADTQQKELLPTLGAANTLERDVPELPIAPPPSPPPPMQPPTTASAEQDSDEQARLADSDVPKFAATTAAIKPDLAAAAGSNARDGSNSNTSAAPGEPSLTNTALNAANALPPPVRRMAEALGAGGSASGNDSDLNHQDEKIAFTAPAHKSFDLNGRVTPPRSPYEIKTGTVIPGILIDAMNSDLPGEIVAQVSQNVYDTATGSHLLIPQGTRIFGRYDSNVSYGQDRLLINWERLIYPNAATLELGGMSGHDAQGDAGFADQVDHHYLRIFGWALTTAVLSAGYQLSQPQQSSVLATPTSSQVIAASVGQQASNLGTQIAQRNLQIQPTIRIRKGYRMLVMVNKDIVFPGSYQP